MKALGVDLLFSRGLYGPRRFAHLDAYMAQEGWYFIELGPWTVEVDTTGAGQGSKRWPIVLALWVASVVLIPSPFFD